ncbi:hypothetical protein BKA59DRAFT_511099 [Fusarium tricinctum]|uniref:Uncharacterized protein n=1 Tax=Fusarium tricinctum TaxID=61284 RepID=A0A8K0RZX9_9HYPO|nr:hypothetical protein BKA59DRAFT_511099 [Fusarium tricinctum]
MAHGAIFTDRPRGLLSLPVELLSDIISEIVGEEYPGTSDYRWVCCQLKNLRLTHERFYNLDFLNAILFAYIQMEATREGLTSYQGADLSRVARFVETVTFVAPPSWMLLRETFEQIIIDSSLIEPISLTKAEVESRYTAYMNTAREAQVLLEESKNFQDVWIQVLKTLGEGLQVIKLTSKHCPTSDLPGGLLSHYHTLKSHEYGCHCAAAVSGDRLFTTVMSSLADSRVSVPKLDINVLMTGNVKCTEIPGWDDIDLSKLETLTLMLRIPTREVNWSIDDSTLKAFPSHTFEMAEKGSSDIVQSLVDKCRDNLLYLDLWGDGAISWPTQHLTYDLSALEHVTYSIDTVRPALLAHAVTRMPSLRRFETACVKPSKGCPYVDWRHFFDAIRDHQNIAGPEPQGLCLDIHRMRTGAQLQLSYEGVICHDSSIATERYEPGAEETTACDHLADERFVLEKHLYGETPFSRNYRLRYMLDDWAPGMIAEETDPHTELDARGEGGMEQETN